MNWNNIYVKIVWLYFGQCYLKRSLKNFYKNVTDLNNTTLQNSNLKEFEKTLDSRGVKSIMNHDGCFQTFLFNIYYNEILEKKSIKSGHSWKFSCPMYGISFEWWFEKLSRFKENSLNVGTFRLYSEKYGMRIFSDAYEESRTNSKISYKHLQKR